MGAGRGVGSALHFLQTLPGMLAVQVAAIAGAIGALAAVAVGLPRVGMALIAAAAFVLVLVLLGVSGNRSVKSVSPVLEPRFASPS